MLVTREVVLAKIEAAYNTDAVPVAGTDAVLVENPSWANEGAVMTERPAVRPSLGKLQQVFGGTLRSISFDVELKGPGAAYSASVKPELGVLLRGCGFAETIDATVGAEKAKYAPASDVATHESLTLYYYQDGQLIPLTGARGSASFQLEAGIPAKASFTFTGHTAAPTDVALPSPTYDSTVPAPFIAAGFSIDSFAAVINALAFDMSNVLSMPKDPNAVDGFGQVRIVDRDVNGSIDPEAELIANQAFETKWRNGTQMVLTTGVIGATQYNRFKVDMPVVYYREISPGDRESIRIYDLPFGATESTTDDEITLEFS